MDLVQYFQSLPLIAALIITVSEYLTRFTKVYGLWAQIQSWAISIAIALLGYFLQLGIFEGINLLWTFIYGISAGLIANGLFDFELIKAFLELIKVRIKQY